MTDATKPDDHSFAFSSGEFGLLFTIKPDGTIVRGPMFTTMDAMSLEFWRCVENQFPQFLKITLEQASIERNIK